MKHLSNWLVTGTDAEGVYCEWWRKSLDEAVTFSLAMIDINETGAPWQDFVVWGNLATGEWEPYFCSL